MSQSILHLLVGAQSIKQWILKTEVWRLNPDQCSLVVWSDLI